jgi:hypothetical protein
MPNRTGACNRAFRSRAARQLTPLHGMIEYYSVTRDFPQTRRRHVHPIRSIVAITAVACLGLPGVALGQLNLVCSVPAEWCKIIADEFQKDTGIKVAVLVSGGREALAMLNEQAGNPKGDVWFGG